MATSRSVGKMPKSILKKPNTQAEKDPYTPQQRELAMHHARLIQYQKDTEMAILEAIEALIEYPYQTTDPDYPNSKDVQEVKTHLASFRPSDFDSAVEERNLDEKCGYMLCPRPRRKQKTSGKFRIIPGQTLRVVKASELEMWCSDDCAKKALYLRVQLKESPPWDRPANADAGLQLYGEAEGTVGAAEVDSMAMGLQQLALERGDAVGNFRTKSMNVDLQEKFDNMVIDEPVAPSFNNQSNGLSIEGYSSGMANSRRKDPLDMDVLKDRGDILDDI